MAELRNRKKQQTHDALSAAAIALFLERGFDQVSVADIAAAAHVSKPTLFKYFATKQDLVLHRIADHAHQSAHLLHQAATSAPTARTARTDPTPPANPNFSTADPNSSTADPTAPAPDSTAPAADSTASTATAAPTADPAASASPAADPTAPTAGVKARPSAARPGASGPLTASPSVTLPGDGGGRIAWAAGVLRDAFLAGLEQRDPVTGLNDHPEVLAYYRLVFETPALAIRVQQFIADDQAALADALGNDLTAEVAAAQLIATQQVLAKRNYRAMAAGITADNQYPTAQTEAQTAFATFSIPTP
ncbi:TetR family transcriptional regulator [Kribbella voronezhensis]|uniref:TetR family transcriptional regulator n=1 Tax=Kribbella voronezhensis TaxID=2512212 RepID=A0A4R7SXR5_9ACTN|nr:TetR/AcrR family transcriptional regulator [Kribbella voronezhensis]TDU83486.1 TetR family transcriptional regulator [Kribbella voronezhensis]